MALLIKLFTQVIYSENVLNFNCSPALLEVIYHAQGRGCDSDNGPPNPNLTDSECLSSTPRLLRSTSIWNPLLFWVVKEQLPKIVLQPMS
jgi:hypothetical protein